MSNSKMTPDTSASHDDESQPEVLHLRTIRSYVIRGGRLTNSQQNALENLWPKYGIDYTQTAFDHIARFGRDAPLVMEIGFGMGDSLLTMAENNPDKDFIGVEVHRPGVGRLLHEVETRGLTNLKVYCHDAREVLEHCIANNLLDTVQIFFPDPWHKKKHNKRRLIQPTFMALVKSRLRIGGKVHMATDWVPYAEHMMEVMSAAPGYKNAAGLNQYSIDTARPLTKFEKRGQRLGHAVHDLIFIKDS